jgi:predicted NodU family carbamoyl transferase
MAAFVIALFAFFLHAVVESWCLISATSSSRWSTSPHGGGLLSTQPIIASAITTAEKSNAKGRKSGLVLASTPFEANLFGSDEPCEDDESTSPASNPYNPDVESLSQEYLPLAVSPDTRLVLGLNKYSHDTALVAADSRTGKVLFGMSKERLTRRKHDGGNAALLVETCLDQLNLTLLSVDLVVMNNHHHRILPLENNRAHLEWELGLGINGGSEPGYDEPENLFYYDAEEGNSNVIRRHELSHHLAHAYSTVAQAPFESGLCLVADGMGESYRTMLGAKLAKDTSYTSDLLFEGWTCVPSDLPSLSVTHPYDYREAESLYTFAKVGNHSLELRPIWKRFTCENTPPTLYNHGFENMDSLGAVYSRASSTIFGDWNACGKVMGLAPWAFHSWTELETASASEETVAIGTTVQSGRPRGRSPLRQTTSSSSHSVRKARLLENPVFLGSLTDECGFRIDRSIMQGEPLFSRNDPDLFEEDYDGMDGSRLKLRPRYDFDDNDSIAHGGASRTATVSSPGRSPKRVALDAIALAHRVQIDLEASLLDLVGRFKGNHTNLCLAGGVALNSVANGRLSRELGLERTFVSPYPGDDGIAVGCCAFGLFGNAYLGKRNNIILEEEPPTASSYVTGNTNRKPMLWKQPLSPYLGPAYSELDLVEAIEQARPWIEVETIRDNDRRLQLMAEEIESGGVVAWFHSRVRTHTVV